MLSTLTRLPTMISTTLTVSLSKNRRERLKVFLIKLLSKESRFCSNRITIIKLLPRTGDLRRLEPSPTTNSLICNHRSLLMIQDTEMLSQSCSSINSLKQSNAFLVLSLTQHLTYVFGPYLLPTVNWPQCF